MINGKRPPTHQAKITPTDSAPSAEIIDLAQVREDRNKIDWQAITEERRRDLLKRVAAVKRYVAHVERRTLIGDSGGLDWVELHHLPPLEAAIAEHKKLTTWLRAEMDELGRAGKI